jgi:hypothetical protein
MSSSKAKVVQRLAHFRSLTPKQLEKLLREIGIEVGANLIRVARSRDRRSKKFELLLCSIYDKLVAVRPDILERMQADEAKLAQQVLAVALKHPAMNIDQLAHLLADQLPKEPPPETINSRFSRMFMEVLNENPNRRQAVEQAVGGDFELVGMVFRLETELPDGVCAEALTDEQVKARVLRYLDDHYPVAPTAEDSARAFIDRHHPGRKAERIATALLGKLGQPEIDREVLLKRVSLFIKKYPKWTDAELVERLLTSLELPLDSNRPEHFVRAKDINDAKEIVETKGKALDRGRRKRRRG